MASHCLYNTLPEVKLIKYQTSVNMNNNSKKIKAFQSINYLNCEKFNTLLEQISSEISLYASDNKCHIETIHVITCLKFSSSTLNISSRL